MVYDFIVDIAATIWRSVEKTIENGAILTLSVGLLFVLLRQNFMKRRMKKHLPWLFEEERKSDEFIHNQKEIIHNLKRSMERDGLEWQTVPMLNENLKDSAMKSDHSLRWRLIMSSPVHFVKPFIQFIRTKKLMKKLKSRKFILAVVGAALIIANDGLGLGIESETVLTFAGLLATWIVGESAVDAKRAGGKSDELDFTQDTSN